MLHIQYKKRYQGRIVCVVLYKNTMGTAAKKYEYIFFSDLGPAPVSKVL
jgi:hypothetical protein